MIALRLLLVVALLALIAGCVLAQLDEGLWIGLRRIAVQPWGAVTLMDLGCGLLVTGAWIFHIERVRWSVPLWWFALLMLGNIATLAFLLRRTLVARDLREVLLGEARSG